MKIVKGFKIGRYHGISGYVRLEADCVTDDKESLTPWFSGEWTEFTTLFAFGVCYPEQVHEGRTMYFLGWRAYVVILGVELKIENSGEFAGFLSKRRYFKR